MRFEKETRVYIAGCGGMLGRAVYEYFNARTTVKATDIDLNIDWLSYADVRDYRSINDSISEFNPHFILNLAAVTDLEYCELHQEDAWLTNALGAENIALIAKRLKVPLVYISTAGIVDGSQETYHDFGTHNPISVYGKSKYAGEIAVQTMVGPHFVFRAGWMMGGGPGIDKKFINKIYQQIKAGATTLFVVDDKLGTPTYTKSFAKAIFAVAETDLYGVYNQVCSGSGSRYDVAKEFVRLLGLEDQIELVKVGSSKFKKEYFAPRPRSEKLENLKLRARNIDFMPHWKDALADYAPEFKADLTGNPPIASVLMPVYNGEAYLAEAIESLLGQTERNIEVVAVDDGSTDSSREILRRFATRDTRVRVFEEDHRGLVATLNRGLEVACGKYICRLDQDDIAMPDRVEKQVRFLEEHPDHVLVGGQAIMIGKIGEKLRSWEQPLCYPEVLASLEKGCRFQHSSVMFRRAEVLSEGGYDPLFTTAEDYDLWVRLAVNYRLANLPDLVCQYRVHGNQISCSGILRQSFLAMCIKAFYRGASREMIRKSAQAEEGDFFEVLRNLGYSDDEIAGSLAGGFLHWVATLRSAGRLESALKLLSEVEGHLKKANCHPRYLAQAYWGEILVSLDAHDHRRAVRSLLRAFASSPWRTARRVIGKLLAPAPVPRDPLQAEP